MKTLRSPRVLAVAISIVASSGCLHHRNMAPLAEDLDRDDRFDVVRDDAVALSRGQRVCAVTRR